jgi:nucleolysin TIA-1/TIAR
LISGFSIFIGVSGGLSEICCSSALFVHICAFALHNPYIESLHPSLSFEMSDGGPPPSAQLPPPPQTTAGAPGYENGHNGSNPAHLPPPPLAPVIIPQNTNPIPTAITSPMGENGTAISPDSAGGFVRRAAPEPNKRALYVGGLDPRVTEEVLRQIFETTGHVQNVKIIPDKNVGAVSINFSSFSPSRTPALLRPWFRVFRETPNPLSFSNIHY